MNKPNNNRRLNCAIYTRKSTDEGLDKEFNSLDAQRECAEAYIKSQTQEGWNCLPDHYDDGGFTGGNMDRPALKQLLADIEAGKVNCVVVYKVDRLSRSLMDFAKMLEVFERNQIAFVSVTQQFNTTNSMGRLMLNVLLSFAQFEREILSERTRDKIAAARRKGKWSGGMPLLGYDIDPQGGNVTLANAIPKLADTEANGGAGITFNASSPGRATVTVNSEDEISFAISDAAGRNVMSGKLNNYRGSGATAVSSSMQRTLRVLLTRRDSN
jgi:DNA invertase Pin-like site-specific DNA recombinase